MIVLVLVGSMITLEQTNDITNSNLDKYAVDSESVFAQFENKEPILIVDIRSEDKFREGHVIGASHDVLLDSEILEKRVNTIQNRLPDVVASHKIILVDEDGNSSKQTAQTMTEMGITTYYLEGGMNSWNQELVSSSQTTINTKDLLQKIEANEDVYLLDVREPSELLESKIEGVVNIPLSQIFQPNSMNEIPTDKPVVVICGSGNRATIATYALAQNSIEFQVLEGGMKAWNSDIFN